MFITSLIVKVTPSKAMEVSRLLGHIPKLAIYGVHKGENIIVVAETNTANEFENLFRQITSKSSDVLGVCQGNATPVSEAHPGSMPIMEKKKPAAGEKLSQGEGRRLQLRKNTSHPLFEVERFAHV